MRLAFYSVTFMHKDGNVHFSRTFNTKQAARKWAKWLRSQKFVVNTSLYQGQPGEVLIERLGVGQ